MLPKVPMELVIVASNRSKIRHLKECIKSLAPSLAVRSFLEFFPLHMIQDGDVFDLSEHAMQKALYGLEKTGLPCLADESLLVIPSLWSHKEAFHKKRKGLLSDRLLPDTKFLLKELQGKEGLERDCYVESALALALPGKPPAVYHSLVRQEGSMADKEKGSGDLDFDSLFLKHEYNKTLSELAESTRIRISHRRKGLQKLIPFVERMSHALSS